MARETFENPEAAEAIIVTVNGVAFATQLYNKVQRFVPDPLVVDLVRIAGENFGTSTYPSTMFYNAIPDALKALDHSNAVVNYMVAANRTSYCGLNEVAIALQDEKFTIADYIEFETLHGYSVCGFVDSISSMLSFGFDMDDDEIDEAFVVENPLWG